MQGHVSRRQGDSTTFQLVAIFACFSLILLSTFAGPSALRVAPLAALFALAAVYYKRLLAWPSLVFGLTLVILFIPIRRYTIALNLPFQLEPYRIYVLLLLAAWVVALLVDDHVRLRASGLEAPLLGIGAVLIASVVANVDRVYSLALGTQVLKSITFWLSWIVVLVVIASVITTLANAERLLGVMVIGGATLGLLGLIESRTGYNPFNNLDRVIPLLQPSTTIGGNVRFGIARAYTSAQHPIAYGAMLAMFVPPALFFVCRRRSPVWWLALLLIILGLISSVSRTSVVMLVVGGGIVLWLRPDSRRFLPLLLPLAIAAQIAVPGTFGNYRELFFPSEGIVAEQAQGTIGNSRVTSFGPAMDQVARHPFLGLGYGTRIPVGEDKNSFILDDQWLGTLLDTGIAGVVAWVWLFWRFGRRMAHEARGDPSDRGWLLAVTAAAVTSFAVGMFFYDAFSFIQVTILNFMFMGLGCALARMPRPQPEPAAV